MALAVSTRLDKGAVFAFVYDGRVTGLVSLNVGPEDRARKAELGYDNSRNVWGRGLATEAASAVCDWGFCQHALAKIFAGADARNRRFQRVMEKLSMKREAVHQSDEFMDGERVDSVLYSMVRSEWTSSGGLLPPCGR